MRRAEHKFCGVGLNFVQSKVILHDVLWVDIHQHVDAERRAHVLAEPVHLADVRPVPVAEDQQVVWRHRQLAHAEA